MAWPPTAEELKSMVERIAANSGRFQPRMVSPKQYDVLDSMNREGKLNMMGDPKPEHLDEYFKRMSK